MPSVGPTGGAANARSWSIIGDSAHRARGEPDAAAGELQEPAASTCRPASVAGTESRAEREIVVCVVVEHGAPQASRTSGVSIVMV